MPGGPAARYSVLAGTPSVTRDNSSSSKPNVRMRNRDGRVAAQITLAE
jgi:hypothetical protein